MTYNNILSNITKHISPDRAETEYFFSLLHYKEISKKQLLLKEGQLCKYISYVHSGALRAYYLSKEQKRINDHVRC